MEVAQAVPVGHEHVPRLLLPQKRAYRSLHQPNHPSCGVGLACSKRFCLAYQSALASGQPRHCNKLLELWVRGRFPVLFFGWKEESRNRRGIGLVGRTRVQATISRESMTACSAARALAVPCSSGTSACCGLDTARCRLLGIPSRNAIRRFVRQVLPKLSGEKLGNPMTLRICASPRDEHGG